MRFAVKRLTRSDLTFWEYQFRRQGAGNQKSINLNADVFIDVIFPQARTEAGGYARQFPVPLTIYGPGRRPEPYRITRKIIAAGDRQKNWRLNGEFVRDPDFDFNPLSRIGCRRSRAVRIRRSEHSNRRNAGSPVFKRG